MHKFLSAFSLLCCLTGTSAADTFTWDGGGVDSYLSTANNWTFDVHPDREGLDDVIFQGTTRTRPRVDGPWRFLSLSFAQDAPSFRMTATVGGELEIVYGGFINLSSSRHYIEPSIRLITDAEFRVNGPVEFLGPVALDNHTMYVRDPSGVQSSEPIVLASTVSGGFIDVASSGDLELVGEILCDVDVLGGRLVIATDTPQPVGSFLQFAAGSVVEAKGTHVVPVTLQLDGAVTFGGAGDLSVSNGIRGSGSLTMDATGALRLGGVTSRRFRGRSIFERAPSISPRSKPGFRC